MTNDMIRENAAGALALADALTAAGTASTEAGKLSRARLFFAANAAARQLNTALAKLEKEETS